MVGGVEPTEAHWSGNRARLGGKLVTAGERVTSSADEQAGNRQAPEVLGPQPIGPAGRVQRIAEQQKPEGVEGRLVPGCWVAGPPGGGRADRHRAHATTHRAASEHQSLRSQAGAPGEQTGRGSHRDVQHRRPIGRAAARISVGEVEPERGNCSPSQLPGHGPQRRCIEVRTGPMGQQDSPVGPGPPTCGDPLRSGLHGGTVTSLLR